MKIRFWNGDKSEEVYGKLIWVRKDLDGDILFQVDQKGLIVDGTYRDIRCDKFSVVSD